MIDKVNVLGTEYKILCKKYDEEEAFKRKSVDGFCDGYAKIIVVCDLATRDGWEHEEKKTIEEAQKLTLRHEITHAFFYESGLSSSSLNIDGGWATNEEMVDWIAFQGEKIYKVWEEAGCL